MGVGKRWAQISSHPEAVEGLFKSHWNLAQRRAMSRCSESREEVQVNREMHYLCRSVFPSLINAP